MREVTGHILLHNQWDRDKSAALIEERRITRKRRYTSKGMTG